MWQAVCVKDGPILQWWGNRHWKAIACDYPYENSSPTGSNAGHTRHSGFGPANPISSHTTSLKSSVDKLSGSTAGWCTALCSLRALFLSHILCSPHSYIHSDTHAPVSHTHTKAASSLLWRDTESTNAYCMQSYAIFTHIFKMKKVKDAQHSKDRELTKTDTYMSLNLFLSELPHIIFHLYDHIKFLQSNYLQHAYCVDPSFTNKEHISSFKVCSHMVSSWKDGFIIAILTYLCKEMLP